MSSWAEFRKDAPEFAEAGHRLLVGSDGIPIGFLATISEFATPRIAPVCPIFCEEDIYLCVSAQTQKAGDLLLRLAYRLHAFLGENDEEFQIFGKAVEVENTEERTVVHNAIPFKSFNVEDPIFRLIIHRALWVYWERVGEVDTRSIRKKWPVQHNAV